MPSVQIKNVPPDVHRVLRERAAAAGQSLQEYLLGLLVEEARHGTLAEVLDRIDREGAGGSMPLDVAVALVREDRDSR